MKSLFDLTFYRSENDLITLFQETFLLLSLGWLLVSRMQAFFQNDLSSYFLYSSFIFVIGWSIWRVGQQAWLEWWYLSQWHKKIIFQRQMIAGKREEKKAEIRNQLYQKGYSEDLAEKIIHHLFLDDERVLKWVLEQEWGDFFERRNHPLQNAAFGFAAIGLSASLFFLSFLYSPHYGPYGILFFVLILSTFRHSTLSQVIWLLAFTVVALGVVFFLAQFGYDAGILRLK